MEQIWCRGQWIARETSFFSWQCLYFLILEPRVSPWLKGAIYPLIIIEILLAVMLLLGIRKNINVSAGIWGKAKMFLVSIGIIICSVTIIAKGRGIEIPSFVTQILFLVFAVSFRLAVTSFKNHLAKYREQL